MKKDELRQVLNEVEKWCSKNSVEIFYGETTKENVPEVSWVHSELHDWEKFLSVFQRTAQQILIVGIDENDLDGSDENIEDYREQLELEEKEEFDESMNITKANIGCLVRLSLSFFSGGVYYEFEKKASWEYEYYQVLEASLNHQNVGEDEEGMSEQEIESKARTIVKSDKYMKAKDRFERQSLCQKALNIESIDNSMDVWKVTNKAEEIYLNEIKPELDEQLKQKVQELKKKGNKKIEVKNKLGISDTVLNKFWYD